MSDREQSFDLEERLLDYAANIILLCDKPQPTYAARHVTQQLIRSGTSPLGNHGEAEAAESTKDFIHKLRVSLKELRESYRWLKLINRANLPCDKEILNSLLDETDQLIRIFVSSISTARKRL